MGKRDAAKRLLGVLTTLCTHQGRVPFSEIRRRFPEYGSDDSETGRRKFERDKKVLREIGIDLRFEGTDADPGYVIDFESSFLTAPVDLDPEEAGLLAALARDALESDAFPHAQALRVALSKLELQPGGPTDLLVHHPLRDDADHVAALLEPLTDAVMRRKRVRFAYVKGGPPYPFTADPYGLFLERGHWYLCAVPEGESAPRTFRLSRMQAVSLVRPGADGPDFAVPEDFDLRAHEPSAAHRFRVHAPMTVTFRVDPEVSHLARAEWGEPEPDDPACFRVDTTHADAVLAWVLERGHRAEVLEPPALRERMRAILLDLLEAHGAEP